MKKVSIGQVVIVGKTKYVFGFLSARYFNRLVDQTEVGCNFGDPLIKIRRKSDGEIVEIPFSKLQAVS